MQFLSFYSSCRGCINSYLKSSRTPSVPCPMCQRPVNKRSIRESAMLRCIEDSIKAILGSDMKIKGTLWLFKGY
uniref:Uncharacterized protein n=1 Tax=Magallana gigas TaxID=29159 RepID=K1QZD1_MAGGI